MVTTPKVLVLLHTAQRPPATEEKALRIAAFLVDTIQHPPGTTIHPPSPYTLSNCANL